jgi:hypothetical protein
MRRRRNQVLGTKSVTIANVYANLGMELLESTPRQKKNGVVVYEDSETGRIYTFNPRSGLYYTTTMQMWTQYILNVRDENWDYTLHIYSVFLQMKAALYVILASRLA